MNENGYTGQLQGPFYEEEELFEKIQEQAISKVAYVKHLGIQTEVSNIVIINGNEIEVGITGIYEIGNTEIFSIKFKSNTDENSLIDYTIILEEDV